MLYCAISITLFCINYFLFNWIFIFSFAVSNQFDSLGISALIDSGATNVVNINPIVAYLTLGNNSYNSSTPIEGTGELRLLSLEFGTIVEIHLDKALFVRISV